MRSEGKDLLHLRLAEKDGGAFRNILFSDIYGEAFSGASGGRRELLMSD